MSQPAVRFRLSSLFFFLLLSHWSFGQTTRLWEQNRFNDFERGTSRGVAISSSGSLDLAPAFRTLFTSPSTYIWSMASDSEGNAYIASGSPARIYKVTPDGKASILFEAKELEVQVLRVGPDAALYAATSPDGKVYQISRTGASRPTSGEPGAAAETTSAPDQADPQAAEPAVPIDKSWSAKVFFDPKAKYIWDMTFDSSGRLYIATGDQGSIYRVDRSGIGSLFFKSDEPHFRSLLMARDGNVIAGTDGSGLIYRITPAGEGFVLYSAAKKEITALAQDDSGNLYAAGVGDKHSGTSLPTPSAASAALGAAGAGNPGALAAGMGPSGGSAIYRLAPDGSPRQLWESHDDLIYALTVINGSTLLVGTGNRGRVYSVNADGSYADLLKASANQITQFSRSRNGIYMTSANLGKLFLLNYAAQASGEFDSDVFDARVFSKWGHAEVLGRGSFDLLARSGNVDNPDRNWSEWSKVDPRSLALNLPSSRFMQWRVVLHPGKTPPVVESIGINYRPQNVPPAVDNIAVEPGARFPAGNASRSGNDTVTVGFGPRETPPGGVNHMDSPSTATRDPNWIAVRWAAHDDNDDDLEYALYFRGEEETGWHLLKDDVTDKVYSFQSALLPDGAYYIKVVASDAPSHTPEDALNAEKVSQRFVVDTTPPQIEQLAGHVDRGRLHVTFRATDSFSPIKQAEYSIDAGKWQVVEPIGQISDQRTESYEFNIALTAAAGSEDPAVLKKQSRRPPEGEDADADPPAAEDHVVVVRVYDRYDNMSTAKTLVRPQ